MWNKTRATEVLKIQYPIIQGAFGGRYSSVKLLTTVSNIGGMGSYGLNAYPPEEIISVDRQIKEMTPHTYALNTWVPLENDPLDDYKDEDFQAWQKRYKPLFEEMNVDLPALPEVKRPNFEEQIEALIQVKPPVMSFIFGLPPLEVIREFKRWGSVTIAAATTLEEAVLIDESEIDLIIATGSDAGGHRPSFLKSPEDSLVSTSGLLKQVLPQVKKPVIAAGGISNARKAWEYLQMGASAVQIGTAFLATEESNATAKHREKLLSPSSYETELTRAFTGRMARAIKSQFVADYNNWENKTYAAYPLQSQLLGSLIKAYKAEMQWEKVPLWAGKPSGVLSKRTAEELFKSLIHELDGLDV